MPHVLRQATASQTKLIGPFLDDTDFKTPETGLSIANTDIKLSANGGGGGVSKHDTSSLVHRDNGMYAITFDATDSATVGELTGSCLKSGAMLVKFECIVLEEAIYDAIYGANASLGDSLPYDSGTATAVSAGGDIITLRVGTPTPLPGHMIKFKSGAFLNYEAYYKAFNAGARQLTIDPPATGITGTPDYELYAAAAAPSTDPLDVELTAAARAALITALKADPDIAALIAGVIGDYSVSYPGSLPGSASQTLLDKAGLVTLGTYTLTLDAQGRITARNST